LAAIFLTHCLSQSQSHCSGQTLDLLHSFNGADGANPPYGLLHSTDGFFYGTTQNAGNAGGQGTVFKIDSTGTFVSLYSFPDNAQPFDGLVEGTAGNLYGTTNDGGANSRGSIFMITPAGVLSTIYSFSGPDGQQPSVLTLGSDGLLYGVTVLGGTTDNGTVFTISQSGSFKSLYSFPSLAMPLGTLAEGADGNYYGTTLNGGVLNLGSVFQITPSGVLTTLYSFSGPDGEYPEAGLMLGTDGQFYGTTEMGGSAGGWGTIFRISPAGDLTTLHSFPDTSLPQSLLVEGTDGNFYGTTFRGGANALGSIFQITPLGVLTTLYSFSGSDGWYSSGGLVRGNDGRLFGTTYFGGTNNDGTVFALCPGGTPPAISVSDCLPPDTSGLSAFVADHPPNTYTWTLTGGSIDSGQGTHQIAFTSGGAGTPMALSVIESNGLCLGQSAMTMQVAFGDVPTSSGFYLFVCALGRNAVTAGCGGGNFCPTNSVLRSQMAVFLLRGEHSSVYIPPPAVGIFGDVPASNPFASWIEQLYNEGITGGCSTNPLLYCPNNPVSRAGMAVFLLVAEHSTGYVPPACAGIFTDVACPSPFADWIEELYSEGITGGCATNPLTYCPGDPVTRAQMAVFLTVTFNF
jgi:uncharacterized repeat protein (TIGR03803 family)